MFDERVMAQVGKMLTLMSAPPRYRTSSIEGDLRGDYDGWFDGGAVKIDTGVTTYTFEDGARARTGSWLATSMDITLADGSAVTVVSSSAREGGGGLPRE